MQPVNVIAIITAKPGKRDAVLAAFKDNVPAVHAEKGCIEYNAVIDMEGIGGFQAKLGENSFAVIEKWESMDALMAHAVSDHMKAYGAKTKDMLESRTIHVLTPA
ncbi:antibiotic biosynthesis monooxygenase [Sneathiella chungangensis]|uniref:Antibiotic biosynthesis monooxygenase n=1 Tax=Sneathiella chungangensis TaxID=1418234 RepID=A0A845MGA2_9PROT|nr:putative quinol monooxygenase [Sneathiella chungangensis]MZR23018.1 antibiotic biosynthesis monooxygenase [Sneathiella chungangensis]